MQKILYLLAAMSLMLCDSLAAQGFNTFSERNHPHLKWLTAETEHFILVYPERLSGIEELAAPIAEESYRALAMNMDVEFDRKIRIYFTDQDEITNGFAVPFGNPYSGIWVHVNEVAEQWTGREKWLRKVIAHEIAHIFHFRSVWTPLGVGQVFFGEPIARFWTEGIAQYQTETWDSQRGDRWLRKAIFDSRPNFNDGRSLENGRLLYAVGNSQVRYFTETYGDTALVDLLAHRNKALGLFSYHDFWKAFDATVDGGYSGFYDEWLKHVNIYYNTLASQMERVDSLHAEPLSLPGRFLQDAAASPDGRLIATLTITSLDRPVRRLHLLHNDSTGLRFLLAEGSINPDLSWSSDGRSIYYSRKVRGENSSIVNDLFEYNLDTGRERQLTHSLRARYPVRTGNPSVIGFIKNESGTGNLFLLDTESGRVERVTEYSGDVQLAWPVWIPERNRWLYYRFDEAGLRQLVLLDPDTGDRTVLGDGTIDNRKPVVPPGGSSIYYTSLRDEVPNVFRYDIDEHTEQRVTHLFTGADLFGWIPPDEHKEDSVATLLVRASETKTRDRAYLVDAGRAVNPPEPNVPEPYASWRQKTPPAEITSAITPDPSLVTRRGRYRSLQNLTHVLSFPFPYYADTDNWGVFGTTNWVEPLGKHAISGLGWFSIPDPSNSYGVLAYANNQLYPSLQFSAFRAPGNARFYGDRFLIETRTGGDLSAIWPIDRLEGPYRTSAIGARLQFASIRPLDRSSFAGNPVAPVPERGDQLDLQLVWQIKKQRPWADNVVHPLDGWGVQLLGEVAEKVAGTDVRFARAGVRAFSILPGPALHRIAVQGAAQIQWGRPFVQDFIGFSRADDIDLQLPTEVPISFFSISDRVRGYREFVSGRQVLFGSVEYRVPVLASLETRVLGVAQFGATTVSLFSDAGVVGEALRADGTRSAERRWGAGAEIKNAVTLFSLFRVSHALGIAQPVSELFGDDDYDFYYRVRAVIPF
ncbi:MAG: hypothetical protein ACNA78_02675 [Balneolaceae bacterium]